MEVLNQNLPAEIQMNILSCLPVKSLLRFRCVSKQFRSLISDPYFVKFHLNRSLLSKNYQKVFLSSFPPQSIDYESFLDNHNNKNALVELDCPSYSYVSVIGSCNGLICYVDHRVYGQSKVIIYNPSTRVSKELPKPPNPLSVIIAYYGFGFDSSDNDYKVVLAMEETEVFSEMIIEGQTDLKFYMLGGFDECLYALSPSFTANGTSVEMWLMKEYGGKAFWAKFITIPCDVTNTCLKPLCFLRNGELLVANDQRFNDQIKLGSYNTKNKGFTRISSCSRSNQADLYAESLVNPTALT
ncbi:F-box/kelch-repeat protein At3g06240-like [Cornus florida]|uniref:F-box/kelch-repeat protein At3g06240-like n=1 Tax=Cornus florida TaxID=4283 RepID=UPI00289CEBEF|nr:F-box/kelch-repeat protein At3g06240-like [Cornus florida]